MTLDVWTAVANSGPAVIWDRMTDPLYRAYSRPYHNHQHVQEMIGFISASVTPYGPDWWTLYWAAIYHDFVYDPTRADNEERSAMAAVQNPKVSRRIVDLIRATKDHKPTGDPLSYILLDADMFILAAPKHRYDEYCRGLREEYAHLTDAQWVAGRSAFLGSLRLRIFSNAVPEMFNDLANHNILRELRSLSAAGAAS